MSRLVPFALFFLVLRLLPSQPLAGTPVTALAFSPDGSSWLQNGHGSVEIHSVSDGKLIRVLKCPLAKITDIKFNRRTNLLAVAGGVPGESGKALLLDFETGKIIGASSDYDDLVTSIDFSPDGSELALASADQSAAIHALANFPKAERSLLNHTAPVLGIAFSPDGKWIVTASADRSLKVWEASSGKLVRTFSHHTAIVQCVAFRRRQNSSGETPPLQCASGSDDRTVRVWQPDIGRMVRIVRGHGAPILTLVYGGDATKLFSAGSEGIVRVIDADSDEILKSWKAHDDWIYRMALSPDGKILATGDWAGKVKLWDAQAGLGRLIRE